jgi:hypothetical protein
VHPDEEHILIRVSRWGFDSDPELGTSFDLYEVGAARDREIGWGNVRGTASELRTWSAAGTAFVNAFRQADESVSRVVRPRYRWLRLLPGHAGRAERAVQEHRRTMAAAKAIYQPVFDEIVRREAAADAERRQQDEEQRRFQEEAEAAERERERRQEALANRAIWAWSAVGPTTVRVVESAEHGLTAAELDVALRGLHGSGLTTVEWDPAVIDAIARACALPGTRPSHDDFQDWWDAVTDHGWDDPAEIPAPSPSDPHAGRKHATTHHSDYAGGSDGLGGHGTSHGTSF